MINIDTARRIRKASRITFWGSLSLLFVSFLVLDVVYRPTEALERIQATLAVMVLIIALLAGIVYLAALKLGQAEISDKALEAIARDGRPVILFLRSFDVAQAGLIQRVLQAVKVIAAIALQDDTLGGGPSRYDVEEELDTAIGNRGTFLAIGSKRASYGSTKLIVGDADWQATFHRLTDAASIIFMMLGPSPAVLWELSEIVRSPSLLNKTIFIMPREGSMPVLARGFKSLKYGAEWSAWTETAKLVTCELGVTLPRYNNEGCFFRLDASGRPTEAVMLERFTEVLKKYLKRQSSLQINDVCELWQSV